MDAGDAEAEGGELGGLVVHEGDEGRDDQRGAAAGEGGELVAEALAGAGGHDEQDVATGCCGLADDLLVRTELAVTEDAVEELGEGFGLLKRGHCLRLSSHGRARTAVVGMCRVWHPPSPPPGDFWPQSILLRRVKGGLVAVRWGSFGRGAMELAGMCWAVGPSLWVVLI